MILQPQKYDFSRVKGISCNQLQQHYQLYLGYIHSLKHILAALGNTEQNTNEYRGLKEGETYVLNGIVLHELYFSNLGPSIEKPDKRLLWLIKRDFGGYQNWLHDFLQTGEVARGWSILAFNHREGKLHNFMQDAHNIGAVWDATPLLVLDVYEHAYMIDFGINRKRYLEIFRQNIDWAVINKRFNKLHRFLL